MDRRTDGRNMMAYGDDGGVAPVLLKCNQKGATLIAHVRGSPSIWCTKSILARNLI